MGRVGFLHVRSGRHATIGRKVRVGFGRITIAATIRNDTSCRYVGGPTVLTHRTGICALFRMARFLRIELPHLYLCSQVSTTHVTVTWSLIRRDAMGWNSDRQPCMLLAWSLPDVAGPRGRDSAGWREIACRERCQPMARQRLRVRKTKPTALALVRPSCGRPSCAGCSISSSPKRWRGAATG